MAVIKTDTFTESSDTALESHTSDSGGGWTGGNTTNFDVIAATDELANDSGSFKLTGGDEAPGSADYWCSVNGKTVGTGSANRFASMIRYDGDVWASASFYMTYIGGNGTWFMFKNVEGSLTQLDTGTISGFSASTYYDIETRGEGNQIESYIESVGQGAVTDSDVSAAGNVGIYMRTTSPLITSLNSETIGAAPSGNPFYYYANQGGIANVR